MHLQALSCLSLSWRVALLALLSGLTLFTLLLCVFLQYMFNCLCAFPIHSFIVHVCAGGSYSWHSIGATPGIGWGRETSAVVFGDKIVSFGGSTNNMQADEVTNAIACFDTRT
jgi:hypothetical protein